MQIRAEESRLRHCRFRRNGCGSGQRADDARPVRDYRRDISILEASPILGGRLDGAGDPSVEYSMRGGRMMTIDNHECTWGLYKSTPHAKSLQVRFKALMKAFK